MDHPYSIVLTSLLLSSSRPKTIDDISSQEQAVAVLKKALQSNNVSSKKCIFMNG
jgi:hypothetical protein